MRIVSLSPSSTEIVCSLGMGKHLVGRSHECDYPGWIHTLPSCIETKWVHEDLSLYRVDMVLLRSLRPDVILTQNQHVESLKDLWRDIVQVADALKIPQEG